MAQRLDRAGLVGDAVAGARQRVAQQAEAKHLRRLRRPLVARSTVAPTRPSRSRFSVSATGSASRPPTASSRQASISRVDPLGPHQAARGVVHQHPVVGARAAPRQLGQAVGHRRGARGAAAARDPGALAGELGHVALELRVVGRQHDQRRPAAAAPAASAASVCATIGAAGDLDVLLGPGAAGARADAGAGHEREQAGRAGGGGRRGHRARF